MRNRPATLLRRLEASRDDYSPGAAARKVEWLRALGRARLATPDEVLRLHEHLCFLRAYPDGRKLLAAADRLLKSFDVRPDLHRHRAALAGSGIAGTDLRDRFFWPMARWLASRWPARLEIDWDALDDDSALAAALPLLVTPAEAAWLRAAKPDARTAIERLRGRASSGAFYLRRVEALPGDDFTREAFFDGVDLDLALRSAPGAPSRTLARYRGAPIVYRRAPPAREKPILRAQLAIAPRAVRAVPPREGESLIDLARATMATRGRDLDAFSYGDPGDVRIVDDLGGLQWAVIGMRPERRAPFRAAYGYLMLRNGVPVGYGQTDTLFGCTDIAFNAFPAFRGGEAAYLLARLLAMAKAVFGARSFTLEPYQLGYENEEGIVSGAWWFYHKLGFRPRNRRILALAETELRRMQRDPAYRSPPRVLRRLAEDYLYFETDGARAPHWPSFAALGAKVGAQLATLAGADREAAVQACVDRAQRVLGVRAPRTPGERIAWRHWGPVIDLLPGLARWSLAERRAAAETVAAKGGRRETDFLPKFDSHPKLGAALRRLAGA
jgi:hypothetical protein